MVIVFHLGRAPGGWLGVEMFFVLSGFLITILLLIEAKAHRYSRVDFGAFYMRRAGRLAPALILVAAASAALAAATGTFPDQVAWGALLSVFYVANWGAAGGYDYGALQHTWSLNIEEQFYFLWPILLIAICARWGSRGVVVAGLAGFVASTAVRAALIGREAPDIWFDRVYYATDTRAAGLMIGCAAGAALFRSRGALARRVPSGALVALASVIGIALVALPLQTSGTWWVAVPLFDISVAVLLIGVIDRGGPLPSALSVRPLTWVGDISYGLYLWQGPVIYFASFLVEPTLFRMAIQLVVPFVLAGASYYLVEQPIRRRVSNRAATRLVI